MNYCQTVRKNGQSGAEIASVDSSPPGHPGFPVQEELSLLTTEDRIITKREVPCRFPDPLFWIAPQSVFGNILSCIVAKYGHFRKRDGLLIANRRLK